MGEGGRLGLFHTAAPARPGAARGSAPVRALLSGYPLAGLGAGRGQGFDLTYAAFSDFLRRFGREKNMRAKRVTA